MSDPRDLFDPSRLTRREFIGRSAALGLGAAAAAMTWDSLSAGQARAAATPLPPLSQFLTRDQVTELIKLGLSKGGEFAEVFAEYTVNTSIRVDEQKVKSVEYGVMSGAGIRVIIGDQVGYAYADSYDMDELREAARVAAAVARSGAGSAPEPFSVSIAKPPFVLAKPLPTNASEETKLAWCRRVDEAARAVDGRIQQVTVNYGDTSRRLLVANSIGTWAEDEQYVTRLTANALALDGTNRQSANGRLGGQVEADYFEKNQPEQVGRQAAEQAIEKLGARDAVGGAYEVVIGPGWGGVLVHECFGHSLEGDGIRKKTSVRASQFKELVAAPIVNIYDDSTVPHCRGTFRVDDEGTPSRKSHVVTDGILTGYLWDYLNGKLTGNASTGNGRRNSYRDYPIPRMTNTYIGAGDSDPAEIIRSVKSGLYCKDMGGGSVDPASGNFSFQVTSAYQIENGELTHPVKNTTLAGNATDAMMKIVMVGNDLHIDPTTGNCGKEGQWKPVSVGQPTVKFSEITVGGTA